MNAAIRILLNFLGDLLDVIYTLLSTQITQRITRKGAIHLTSGWLKASLQSTERYK